VRILYDATPLLLRSAGVKNYHHTLLRYLIPNIAPHDLRLFPFLKSLTPNHNERSNYPPLSTALRLGGVLASNYLGVPLPALGADLFHVTPHVWRLPDKVCLTSMIHDPTPVLMPECHTASNVRYFKRFVEETARRLDGVMVPSQAVKRDLAQSLPFSEEQITVVPHGVDDDFFEATAAALQAVRANHNLPPDYILTVGSLEPRKNLTTLIKAFSILPESLRRQYPLVIAGASGWKNKQLKLLVEGTPYVHLAGYVRRRLLPALYHGATLFVFPSLYEGFGLPLVEAMAARLPVIASNRSAMPEVVGDAGLLVDPLNEEKLARTIERLLHQPDEAARLGEAGYHQARLFTWQRTAAATKTFFEQVYGRAGA
jgi:alpha-1,3-rhamnosyl/mannosyltransferase